MINAPRATEEGVAKPPPECLSYDYAYRDKVGTVMGQDRIKRRVTRIKVGTQLGLDGFDAEPGLEARQVAQGRMAIRFEDPDPRDIRFGTQRLDAHLREMGLGDALVLRQI